MADRGDETGVLWCDPVKQRGADFHSSGMLPPIPDTGWCLPTDFPDLSMANFIAVDTETYDPELREKGPGSRRGGYLVGVAVGTDYGYRQYFPIEHQVGPNCDKSTVLAWLSRELSRQRQPKVGANLLYDLEYLAIAGVTVTGPFYDVQVAEPLLDETALSYSLETLARKYEGEGKRSRELEQWLRRAFGQAETNWKANIWRAPPAVAGPYAESDVDLPLRIIQKQLVQLEREQLMELFKLESALIPMLLAMRLRGVAIDLGRVEEVNAQMKQGYQRQLAEIKNKLGFGVDIWAASSIEKAFKHESLDYPRTAKTKAPSFTKGFLEHHPHWLPKMVMEARRLDKLRGTFIEGYLLNGHRDGRIYGQFNQLKGDEGGTVSGRFSSSHPNLQNIPKRDLIYGPMIRSLFIPEDGQLWWKFDWSQIEYRLIVHYAARSKKTRDMRSTVDAVARYMQDPTTDFHQAIAEMTGLTRPDAKNLNFGLAYGQGIELLCYNLGVDEITGRAIINEYHERAPFIKKLSYSLQDFVQREGYVETILKRRRRFNAYTDGMGKVYDTWQPGRKRAFTHKALNALIQGSAADIMKLAMVRIWEAGLCDVLGAPHLTVHDELDGSFDASNRAHREALYEMRHIMQTCIPLKVPMLAERDIGYNWSCKND